MKTIDEVRDEIIRILKAERGKYDPDVIFLPGSKVGLDITKVGLDITTLDGIAAMWPKGWEITIEQHSASDGSPVWEVSGLCLSREGPDDMRSCAGPTEVDARTRLLLAVLESQEPRP